MIYITGDTHGRFERIFNFCQRVKTNEEDLLIILGDAGINYDLGLRDRLNKHHLSKLPITILSLHGNHEARPSSIESYHEREFKNGIVYVEDEFPNLLFAKDGEIFHLDGLNCLVIGGAYSVDKSYRLENGWKWWPDEQPSAYIKAKVEETIRNHQVDVVLSHTCPRRYEPVEVFLGGIDQSQVDSSTEKWLEKIEETLDYRKWYCGHFHTAKKVDKMEFMFDQIQIFMEEERRVE